MSDRLRDRIVQRIKDQGPLPFAVYMDLALYDPADGFFAGAPVGETAHFVTSPHVSPAFATLLATQLGEIWESLGRPSPFVVIEAGAGDGTLAEGIRLAATSTEWVSQLQYRCVEQSPVARGAIAARGMDAHASIEEAAPEPVAGVVLANELFDNLPFHRIRRRGSRLLEVYVGERDGRLVEVEGPAGDEAIDAMGAPIGGETEQPTSPVARRTVEALARALARGYLVVFDYGFVAGEDPGPVRGYRGHRLIVDLLADPGGADITGPVDFDALADAARGSGLTVWGPVSQRDALLALGYRGVLDALRSRQHALERAGSWREAVSLFDQRGRAAMLVDEHGLGSLKVLAAGTPGLPPPLLARRS